MVAAGLSVISLNVGASPLREMLANTCALPVTSQTHAALRAPEVEVRRPRLIAVGEKVVLDLARRPHVLRARDERHVRQDEERILGVDDGVLRELLGVRGKRSTRAEHVLVLACCRSSPLWRLTPATKRLRKPPIRLSSTRRAKPPYLVVLIVDDVEDRMRQMPIDVEGAELDHRARRHPASSYGWRCAACRDCAAIAIDVVVAEAGAAKPGPRECACRVRSAPAWSPLRGCAGGPNWR